MRDPYNATTGLMASWSDEHATGRAAPGAASNARLTFRAFQDLNLQRSVWHPDGWPVSLWCLAIAAEAGELCDLVKKVERGDFTLRSVRQQILEEIADVMTYCDRLMSELGADTEIELQRKF